MISHAKLHIPVPIELFRLEVNNLDAEWIAHFNHRHFEGQWTVLSLRSPGGKENEIVPDQLAQQEYTNTRLLDFCPSIQSWLAKVECPLLSVRLLNLTSHSIIKDHRDHELCYENGEARLHVPIFTNPGVEFYLNNSRIVMEEGQCWYINANLPHRVANHGDTDRIHLVVDCKVNEWLRKIFLQSEQVNVPDHSTETTLRIIQELRLSNTPVTNQLADELEKKLGSASEQTH